MPNQPVAYFITFSCYGTWLHGRAPGSVDKRHNEPGTPFIQPRPTWEKTDCDRLSQKPYALDAVRRRVVLAAIQEVCRYRGWELLAAHVRSNHVPAVVHADAGPEKVMNDFKAYASRALNRSHVDPPNTQRWTRHGSTLYLWNEEQTAAKIAYVVEEQGAPMEVFCAPSGIASHCKQPPLPNGRGSDRSRLG